MAFVKKVWSDGEILDADNMNRIEKGIDDLSNGESGSASPTWEYNIYKDNLGLPIYEEIELVFTTEAGTLKDDTSGITGDKTDSTSRLRMTDKMDVQVANGSNINIDIPTDMGMWINLYTPQGDFLRAFSTSTLYSSATIPIDDTIGYIWVIFRTRAGDSLPTSEQMEQVRIYYEKVATDSSSAEPELLTTISVVAKNAYNLDLTVEGGNIDKTSGKDSDTIALYKQYIRSGLMLSVDGATKISFNTYLPKCTVGYAVFYDTNMAVLYSKDFTPYENNTEGNVSYGVMDLRGDEKYLRIVFKSGAFSLKTINITVFNAKRPPKECKKIRWNSNYSFDNITYPVNSEKTICGTLRIFLPPNYSANGAEKVPLIYYLPGSGNWHGWNAPNWPGTNATLYNGLSYCMNEGFAVCTIYGWGDYYHQKYSPGSSHPYAIPTCLQVIQDAIDWLVSRYNIDGNNIHVMSKSQGGQNSAYWVSRPFPGLRTVGMCAPVVDYFSMPAEPMYNAPRKAIAEDLALEGEVEWFSHGSGEYTDDQYWTYKDRALEFIKLNKAKFAGMNEAWVDLHGGNLDKYIQESWESGRAYWGTENADGTWTPGYKAADANIDLTDEDIYKTGDLYSKTGRVPCKLWSGTRDDNTPHWKNVEFIKHLQNGGSTAILRTYSGGHSSFDYGGSNAGTTALGIPYSGVCNYYIENIQFIRQFMP